MWFGPVWYGLVGFGMGYYEEYLKTPEWKITRAKQLKLDNYTCRLCGREGGDEIVLEVHHSSYERLGCEIIGLDLITLCDECHEPVTSMLRERRYEKREIELEDVEEETHGHRRRDDYEMGDTAIRDSRNSTVNHAQYPNVESRQYYRKRNPQDF